MVFRLITLCEWNILGMMMMGMMMTMNDLVVYFSYLQMNIYNYASIDNV